MTWTKRSALFLTATYLFTGTALAADVYIYPQKGQSQQQQEKDKYECYSWAKQQTGFDPVASPQATSVRSSAACRNSIRTPTGATTSFSTNTFMVTTGPASGQVTRPAGPVSSRG